MDSEFEEVTTSFYEYWIILKRRRYLLIVPTIVITFAGLLIAFSLPSIYRSEARILIEDQNIPEDIVGATITNYASQQIQLISQRLLTVKSIEAVVKKFDLYDTRGSEDEPAPSTLASWFRRDMELHLVSTDVTDPRAKAGQATIAFTLAFNSVDPRKAKETTEELVQMFLNESERSTTSKATQVSAFLRSSVEKANAQLTKAEQELADFKAANEGALPELHDLNVNSINRMDEQLSDANRRIEELEQRKLQLSAQLSPLSPTAPVTLPSGETIMSDRERLKALLVDFRRKSAIYQPDHPDLVALRREIDTLRSAVGKSNSTELLQEQLDDERKKLADLLEKYAPDHPDVQRSRAAIAALEAQLKSGSTSDSSASEVADNPAYVLIKTQLQSADLEIQSVKKRRAELQGKIDDLEELLRKAPHVEMEYDALMRKYNNAQANYRDLEGKLRAADVAANVEQEITGRRYTLLEPPNIPISPSSPKRRSIAMIGFLIALGAGVCCVWIAEIVDKSIRTVKKLAEVAGAPPIAVIPYLNNHADIVAAGRRRNKLVIAMIGSSALILVVVHLFVWPLSQLLE